MASDSAFSRPEPRDRGNFARSIGCAAVTFLFCGCAEPDVSEERLGATELAIADGTDDVTLDSGGAVRDDIAQWRRDASVSIVSGCAADAPVGGSFCSGVLVAPRVVLTNAHCIFSFPNMAVSFSPINPGVTPPPGATIPPGTPAPFCVPVVGCATHPQSSRGCGDGIGGGRGVTNPDRDLAVLILDRRMDHGEEGTRTQDYKVIPATIVPNDDEIFGIDTPDSWTERGVWHVGYGPVEGCVPFGGPLPAVRQVANQHVEFGNWIISGFSSSIALFGMHGLPGDSGGPIYLRQDDRRDPLRLLAVHRGAVSFDALPTCAPEPSLVRDHGVRLTHSSIQGFLATAINQTVSGPAFPGSGILIRTSTTPSAAPGELVLQSSAIPPLWTGDVDLPPRTEPAARAASGASLSTIPDEIDPDGDGLVGARDNCWGFSNIEQRLGDANRICCVNDGGTTERASNLRPECQELCPLPGAALPDCDGDGTPDICEDDTDGDSVPDECDNCAGNFNPDQADCNAEAHTAFNQRRAIMGLAPRAPRGDVCDPVPCANTQVRREETTSGGSGWWRTQVTFDRMEVDGVLNASTQSLRTGFRFCRCSAAVDDTPATRFACAMATATPGDGNCRIGDPNSYDSPVEQLPWRSLSFTERANVLSPALPLRTEVPINYGRGFTGMFRADWNSRIRMHGDDIPRWSASSLLPFGATESFSPDTISGVIWSHTAGRAGGPNFGPETRQLANHYFSGRLPDAVSGFPVLRELMIALGPIRRGWDWLGGPGFVLRERASGRPVVLMGNSVAATKSKAYDFQGLHHFAHPGPWVVAAEPSEALDRARLRYVALNDKGGVDLVLAEVGGGLVDAEAYCAQRSPKECGQVFGELNSKVAPPSQWADAAIPAFNSKNTKPVLSATRNMLFMLQDGSPTAVGLLGSLHLVDGNYHERPLPQLGEVLTATYSHRDQVLWIFDQVPDAKGSVRVRLLGVRPETGGVNVAGEWLRSTSNDRFALVTAPDGSLYLAAGRENLGYHCLAHVEAKPGKAEVLGVAFDSGDLPESGPLTANVRGVTLLTEHGKTFATRERAADAFKPGDLAKCF